MSDVLQTLSATSTHLCAPQNISVYALSFEHGCRRTVSEADGLGRDGVPEFETELGARGEHRSHPWRCVSAILIRILEVRPLVYAIFRTQLDLL